MKIFGIGLPRTGTASLSTALSILGYKTKHYPKYKCYVKKFEALTDSPIPAIYKELDLEYHGSKFILTTRDIDSWLSSVKFAAEKFRWGRLRPNHRCGPEVYNTHIKLFNTLQYDEVKMVKGYYNHHIDVKIYFKNRNDLLILDIQSDNKWGKLCKFLNKDIPNIDFPHQNKKL